MGMRDKNVPNSQEAAQNKHKTTKNTYQTAEKDHNVL